MVIAAVTLGPIDIEYKVKRKMSINNYDILIAEDDQHVAELLALLFSQQSYKTKIVFNGQEAIDTIDSISPPKLVLLDVMMPIIDGLQVVDHIRTKNSWASTPIIMLTAKSQDQDISIANSKGISDYVVKPFDASKIIPHLEKFINKAA